MNNSCILSHDCNIKHTCRSRKFIYYYESDVKLVHQISPFYFVMLLGLVTSVSTADDIIVISQSIISFDAHCDLCSSKAT